MKTIEQFWNEITTNRKLAEKLTKVTNEQELEAFLKENEVSGTTEDFKALVVAKAKASGELSDEQLEAVSGGSGLGQFVDQWKKWLNYLFE